MARDLPPDSWRAASLSPLNGCALFCLAGTFGVCALMVMMGVGAPPASSLIRLTSFGVALAVLGLVLCGVASWIRPSTLTTVTAVLIMLTGGASLAILIEGLQEKARFDDLIFCSRAEREGRTIPRGEAGYKRSRDDNRNGVACERELGPQCYQGRCEPIG